MRPAAGLVGVDRRVAGVRAARPVRARRVELGDDRRQRLEVVAARPTTGRRAPAASPSPSSPRCSRCCRSTAPGWGAPPAGRPASRASATTSLGQRRLLGVGGAGEQEVLPDQDSTLVGAVVEVVALVHPAAPDPQQVDARVDGVVEAAAVARPVDPGDEHVVRDPVGATREHRLTVDAEEERQSVAVRVGVQLDGTEAHPARPRVELCPLTREDQAGVVERLVAVAARPPQPGGRHLDGDNSRALAGGDLDHRGDLGTVPGHLRVQAQRHLGRALELDVEGDNACAVRGNGDLRAVRRPTVRCSTPAGRWAARCRRWAAPDPSPSRSCRPSS